jgi:hypothetical protein
MTIHQSIGDLLQSLAQYIGAKYKTTESSRNWEGQLGA